MRTGKIDIRQNVTSLNLARIAQAAQRIFEAAREISSDRSLNLPIWRLTESIRHAQRQVSPRVVEVVRWSGLAWNLEPKSVRSPKIGALPDKAVDRSEEAFCAYTALDVSQALRPVSMSRPHRKRQ
jgi:hypothetical protein